MLKREKQKLLNEKNVEKRTKNSVHDKRNGSVNTCFSI